VKNYIEDNVWAQSRTKYFYIEREFGWRPIPSYWLG